MIGCKNVARGKPRCSDCPRAGRKKILKKEADHGSHQV